ncbi:MAG: HvfB family MNIO-type RiPP peptide maturase [Pseudomonadales bacterium]
MQRASLQGAGLGLRRDFSKEIASLAPTTVDFFEVAPENWIGIGGRFGKQLRACSERWPLTLHGLSLDIGGFAPLNTELLHNIKSFMQQHGCELYSEHLTYCADEGQLYDLLPIPFTEEAVHYVAGRVRQAQDILGRRMALENASYYAAAGQELSELQFINAVIAEADCDLLLDVNNIYVNSINHRYDPYEFLSGLPGESATYIHIAGHYKEAEDLRVDTHGADVIDPVWDLLRAAYQQFGVLPTLLERDFNIPPLTELLGEVALVRRQQRLAGEKDNTTCAAS